jgi:signal peptidase I
MDKKSKVLIIIFAILIIISIVLVYKRSFVSQNFEIEATGSIDDTQ